jgi:hypothetical protein
MPQQPRLRFLSLFVPNLPEATERYTKIFGVEPSAKAAQAPVPHPFAAAGPVLFDLGTVQLALYQCDMKATHPGDVGIGLRVSSPTEVATQAQNNGGRVFYGPKKMGDSGPELAVFVLPDRHFFEVVGPTSR